MELKIVEVDNQKIAEVITDDVVLNDTQDALDLMTNADHLGARSIIMEQGHLTGAFFDLRTGLAGEILQKYATYDMKLAVIGDFEQLQSKSLQAFIVECNRGNSIFFVGDRISAISKITRQ